MEKIDLNPNELSIDRLEQVTVKLNEIVDWINNIEARQRGFLEAFKADRSRVLKYSDEQGNEAKEDKKIF